MFLKSLKQIRHTVGFRRTLWYAALFLLSHLVLFSLTYVLLAASLRQKDHDSIRAKLHDLAGQYHAAGLEGLKKELALQAKLQKTTPFFIRFAAPSNTTLFVKIPNQWANFDLRRLEQQVMIDPAPWLRIPAKDEDEVLEIAAVRLADGSLLQVGKSTEDRDDLLKRFAWIVGGIMLPVVGGSVLGGLCVALRALQPIRHLIHTVRAIEAGTMAARVPTRQTGDELEELGRLFNAILEKITALIQGMRSTLDTVAHDLRTPMTRVRGIAELALRSDADLPTCREALADCVEEVDRVRTLLNTLMDIAEAETGTMTLARERVPIATLLEDVVELYGEVAAAKAIAVATTAPADLHLYGDRNRMRQVLANLLDNALKYTSPGGQVDLSASQEQHQVVITVADTGIGISSEDLPHIWERLYRGDHSRTQRGLGLGLSVVKAVVQAHQGAVDVSSVSGAGSCFTLRLPMATVHTC